MWWFVAGIAIGVAAGRFSAAGVILPAGSTPPRPPQSTIHRLADDLIHTCDAIRPLAFRLRAAAADDRLTLDEWIGLYSEIERL